MRRVLLCAALLLGGCEIEIRHHPAPAADQHHREDLAEEDLDRSGDCCDPKCSSTQICTTDCGCIDRA